MKPKKSMVPLVCAVLFLVMTAGLRALNIHAAIAASDVAYSNSYVNTIDTLHDIAVLLAYGFSAAAVVYSCGIKGRKGAVGTAAMMSAVVLADRVFCLVYDIATSNINIRETGTLSTAITWLAIDFLFFAAMYFGGAFISSLISAKRREEGFPLASLGATVGIMTVLQLVSQLVICVQFFLEYDDVTATEKAQMAGDILWVLVEYGGILAAFAMISYILMTFLHRKFVKKS
ncbi:MAG: hypothetical protein E7660_03810 [Ruminococcaceae bacterium]|nr:hypothetical protein [Oscillospiraceae bacterium]